MAIAKTITASRFDNFSDEALADAHGRADAVLKAAEVKVADLKAIRRPSD